jgi:hypothetical protein
MSKILSQLLGIPEVLAEQAISQMEHLSGWQSTDVRLLAEINNAVRTKTIQLGLDPDDTTGEELYYALKARLNKDEQQFQLTSQEVIEQLGRINNRQKVYALKRGAAKDLLRSNPPKRLMKQLKYRSVDSMLKRENIAVLFAAIQLVESARWQNAFFKDLSKITPSDFETQNIEIVPVNDKRYASISPKHEVKNSELMGAVIVWPNSLSSLNLTVQISLNIAHLRAYCAYIKLRHVEANFGKSVVHLVKEGAGAPLELVHTPISWRTIFSHYGKRNASEHTEYFGPHLLFEDIKKHHTYKNLAKLSPVFKWWDGLEYALKQAGDGLVSLNLADVLAGHPHNYKLNSTQNAQGALWAEFIDRYLDHPSVEQHFMNQLALEPQMVSLEDYKPSRAEEDEIRQLMESMA